MAASTTYKTISAIPSPKREGDFPKQLELNELKAGVIYPTANGKLLYIDKSEDSDKSTICFFDAKESPQGDPRISGLRSLEYAKGDGGTRKEEELKRLLHGVTIYEPEQEISMNGQKKTPLPGYLKNAFPLSEEDLLKQIDLNLNPANKEDRQFVQTMGQGSEIMGERAELSARAGKHAADREDAREAEQEYNTAPRRSNMLNRLEGGMGTFTNVAFAAIAAVSLGQILGIGRNKETEAGSPEEAGEKAAEGSWAKRLVPAAGTAAAVTAAVLVGKKIHDSRSR